MRVTVDRREMASLIKTFKKLPDEVQRKGMDEALLAGAKPIHKATEQGAPIGGIKWPRRRPNDKPLRETIKTIVAKRKNQNAVRVVSTNPIAGPLEFGHDIVTKAGNVVGHAKPFPFMRRAFDGNKGIALRLIQVDLAKTIDRLWKRG